MRTNGHRLHASAMMAPLRPADGDSLPLDGRLDLCPRVVARQAFKTANPGKRWRNRKPDNSALYATAKWDKVKHTRLP